MCGCAKISLAMHSSTGRHGGDHNTDTVMIIGAIIDLQEKFVCQVSYAPAVCLPIFHPLTIPRPGHDSNQRRLYALDRQQTGLRSAPEDLCDGPQQSACIRKSQGPRFWCNRSEKRSWIHCAALPSPDEMEEGRTMMVKRVVGIFLVKQVGNLATLSIRRAHINRKYDDPVGSPRSQRYVCLGQSAVQKHRTKRFTSSHRCESPFAR